VHAGRLEVTPADEGWNFTLAVYLGDLPVEAVAAQLYAEQAGGEPAMLVEMKPGGPVSGAINGVLFRAIVDTRRAAADFSARLVPSHPQAKVPLESNRIHWIER
jgi:starch phosphorylase